MNIIFRAPTQEDLGALVALNTSWHVSNRKKLDNGYLSQAYDYTSFSKIMANQDIVVFKCLKTLVGYFLVNTVIPSPHLDIVKRVYFSCRRNVFGEHLGFSYQIIIDRELQGSGLFQLVQRELEKHFHHKYKRIATTISKDNFRSVATHHKAGWTFIDLGMSFHIIEKVFAYGN